MQDTSLICATLNGRDSVVLEMFPPYPRRTVNHTVIFCKIN